jgi:hypothetical protein
MSYSPEKLSMEKTKTAFSPLDRIGALAIQDISISDNKNLSDILERDEFRNIEFLDKIKRFYS